MTVKYRVQLVESERGWGQEYWHEDYDTHEEAKQRIQDVNSKNVATSAPDWYMRAEQVIEAVEVK
jgi:hypothetical protein